MREEQIIYTPLPAEFDAMTAEMQDKLCMRLLDGVLLDMNAKIGPHTPLWYASTIVTNGDGELVMRTIVKYNAVEDPFSTYLTWVRVHIGNYCKDSYWRSIYNVLKENGIDPMVHMRDNLAMYAINAISTDYSA